MRYSCKINGYTHLNLTKLESRPLPAELQASLGLSAPESLCLPLIHSFVHNAL